MKLQPLAHCQHEIRIGQPLPFALCDAGGRLLLARGRVIESAEQLESLLDREAYADRSSGGGADELAARIRSARPEDLPPLWDSTFDHVGRVLRSQVDRQFADALEQASKPVLALIAKDPDLAILQIVRQDETTITQYASKHAVHAAIAAQLAARRLGWGGPDAQRVFRAALTMNLSMAELQNRLAGQVTALTPLQREHIRSHPERSVELLHQAGITDRDWITAVERHHEHESGKGYPRGLNDLGEFAMLLHRADVFTAKLSARATRAAMAPDEAARRLYLSNQGNPMVAALIKEFGLYPPGAFVRLASGETGIVTRRGEAANTPVVVAVTNRQGELMMHPVRRDTAQAAHAVIGILPASQQKFRISIDKLTRCTHA